MKTSIVVAVLNEKETIESLLRSIDVQTKKPDEVVIVDGGSSDRTLSLISNFKFQISNKKIKFKVYKKKGNRSVGRNYGIERSSGNVILATDAGCVLNKHWVEKITEPFKNHNTEIVAGYYNTKPGTVFEKCLIPYVLVMPDRVDPNNFLPATRSMAFKKEIWKKVGGFNERLSHNEDYEFARKLKRSGSKIVFRKNAIVYWSPRKDFKNAFIMFFRFAYGDAQAGIYRGKVILLFVRYLFVLILIYLGVLNRAIFVLVFYFLLLYLVWVIVKNYRYVKDVRAFLILPLLQFVSDLAVLSGTLFGTLNMPWATQKIH